MSYTIKHTGKFEKSYKKSIKRGKNISKLQELVEILEHSKPVPMKYRDHKLVGNYAGCRECHIEPDWLLIYRIENGVLTLIDTGTHSDLFD